MILLTLILIYDLNDFSSNEKEVLIYPYMYQFIIIILIAKIKSHNSQWVNEYLIYYTVLLKRHKITPI